MKIVSKSAAMKLQKNMFAHGIFLKQERYDMGKYAKMPSEIVGVEAQDLKNVAAVYPVSRQDRDGRYTALYCLCSPE